MSPLRPHPKSLSQDWERDFERFFSPSPNIGKACPELVEGGWGMRAIQGFANVTRPLGIVTQNSMS